jgi:hypothetical protein
MLKNIQLASEENAQIALTGALKDAIQKLVNNPEFVNRLFWIPANLGRSVRDRRRFRFKYRNSLLDTSLACSIGKSYGLRRVRAFLDGIPPGSAAEIQIE